eukprot:EG_transcript_33512
MSPTPLQHPLFVRTHRPPRVGSFTTHTHRRDPTAETEPRPSAHPPSSLSLGLGPPPPRPSSPLSGASITSAVSYSSWIHRSPSMPVRMTSGWGEGDSFESPPPSRLPTSTSPL